MEGGKGREGKEMGIPKIAAGPKFSPTNLAIWVMWLTGVCRICSFQTKILSSVPFDRKKHKIRKKDQVEDSKKDKLRLKKKAKEKSRKLKRLKATSKNKSPPSPDPKQADASDLQPDQSSSSSKTVHTESKSPGVYRISTPASRKALKKTVVFDSLSDSSSDSSMSESGYSSADSLEFGYQMASPLRGLEMYTDDLGADVLWTDGYGYLDRDPVSIAIREAIWRAMVDTLEGTPYAGLITGNQVLVGHIALLFQTLNDVGKWDSPMGAAVLQGEFWSLRPHVKENFFVFYSRLLDLIERAKKRSVKFPNAHIVDRLLVLAAGDDDRTLADKAGKLIEKVRLKRRKDKDVGYLVIIEKLKQATEYREELFLAHRGRAPSNPANDKLLMAEEKESPTDTSKIPCRYFVNGSCARATKCKFMHGSAEINARPEGQKRRNPCFDFRKGKCTREKCRYEHSAAPDDRSSTSKASCLGNPVPHPDKSDHKASVSSQRDSKTKDAAKAKKSSRKRERAKLAKQKEEIEVALARLALEGSDSSSSSSSEGGETGETEQASIVSSTKTKGKVVMESEMGAPFDARSAKFPQRQPLGSSAVNLHKQICRY